MGPVLLSRILDLNDLQTDILSIVFRIADEHELLLVDTKDLKAMLNYVSDHARDFTDQYGRMSTVSIGAILRALVALEGQGGDAFFGETAINFTGTATVTPAPQTVNPPSDVSGYTDVAPEDLFDEFFLIV
jgi:hypothetical protein